MRGDLSSKVQEPREDTGNESLLMRRCGLGGRRTSWAQGSGFATEDLSNVGHGQQCEFQNHRPEQMGKDPSDVPFPPPRY